MGDLIRQERHGPVMVWTLDREDLVLFYTDDESAEFE